MKRILVIGSGGAGKSTVARRLHEITGIELIHLDKLYWQPNWVEPPKDEWKKVVEGLIATDSWIIDGNFGSTLEIRVKRSDTVLFLDFPRTTCLWRVLKRTIRYYGRNRPDMEEGCNERVDFEFLNWIWNFKKKDKLKIEKILGNSGDQVKIFRLASQRDVENFISGDFFNNSLVLR